MSHSISYKVCFRTHFRGLNPSWTTIEDPSFPSGTTYLTSGSLFLPCHLRPSRSRFSIRWDTRDHPHISTEGSFPSVIFQTTFLFVLKYVSQLFSGVDDGPVPKPLLFSLHPFERRPFRGYKITTMMMLEAPNFVVGKY